MNTTAAANDVTFSKFPALTSGNDCEGSDVVMGGKRLGSIYRQVEWTDVGSVSVSYKGKVTGYRVELRHTDDEPVFATLAEARTFARTQAAECLNFLLTNGWK